MIAEAIQGSINLFAVVVGGIISLLPTSPFAEVQAVQWTEYTKWIGLIVPVNDIFSHFTYLLLAIAVWYLYRWILRLVQAIQ